MGWNASFFLEMREGLDVEKCPEPFHVSRSDGRVRGAVWQARPGRTMESVAPSDVVSGRGWNAMVPATAWLANFRCRFATACWKTRSILGFYLHYIMEVKLTVSFSGEVALAVCFRMRILEKIGLKLNGRVSDNERFDQAKTSNFFEKMKGF